MNLRAAFCAIWQISGWTHADMAIPHHQLPHFSPGWFLASILQQAMTCKTYSLHIHMDTCSIIDELVYHAINPRPLCTRRPFVKLMAAIFLNHVKVTRCPSPRKIDALLWLAQAMALVLGRAPPPAHHQPVPRRYSASKRRSIWASFCWVEIKSATQKMPQKIRGY